MKRFLMFLMIIAISLTFLVISLEQNAYNKDFYIEKYKEYDIEEVTGKNSEELKTITDNLILYLKGGENSLLKPSFNEREILHMEDVRALFDLARIIKYIGLGLIILIYFYFLKNKNIAFMAKNLFYGLFINHLLLGIIALLAYIDFNKYFTYFHLIFFSNDLWILNPETDLMIQMLPEVFFIGIAIKIMIYYLLYLMMVQLISYLYMKKNKIEDRSQII